jgi:hypothetical protein
MGWIGRGLLSILVCAALASPALATDPTHAVRVVRECTAVRGMVSQLAQDLRYADLLADVPAGTHAWADAGRALSTQELGALAEQAALIQMIRRAQLPNGGLTPEVQQWYDSIQESPEVAETLARVGGLLEEHDRQTIPAVMHYEGEDLPVSIHIRPVKARGQAESWKVFIDAREAFPDFNPETDLVVGNTTGPLVKDGGHMFVLMGSVKFDPWPLGDDHDLRETFDVYSGFNVRVRLDPERLRKGREAVMAHPPDGLSCVHKACRALAAFGLKIPTNDPYPSEIVRSLVLHGVVDQETGDPVPVERLIMPGWRPPQLDEQMYRQERHWFALAIRGARNTRNENVDGELLRRFGMISVAAPEVVEILMRNDHPRVDQLGVRKRFEEVRGSLLDLVDQTAESGP